jgi:hypothetical protein
VPGVTGGRQHAEERPRRAGIATLERWERHGAIWRVVCLTAAEAVVELRTCHGEHIDELRFTDAETLRYLATRPGSEFGGVATGPSPARSGDEIGKASFPASDPPASWTWEV